MQKPGFFLIVLLSGFLLSVNNYIPQKDNYVQSDSTAAASIAVVGDLMCHSVQYKYARVNSDSFDFRPVYRLVKDLISSADFAFGNLETVTAGKKKGFSGYPFFNSPDEFVSALKDAGFDLLTTSNNHSLDRGEEGLLRTINQVTFNGLGYNGTFSSKADRDSIRIFEINGIRVAFLAYSYGTNGLPIPKGKNYLINLIDTVLIKNDIEAARQNNSDFVLVHYHFGEEYKREPSGSQEYLVNKTIDYGADIIIGGHPHVLQPAEFKKGSARSIDSVFVIYSMGNFISNQQWRYSDAGVILNLNLSKNFKTGRKTVDYISITPTWVFKGKTNRGNEYIIIPEGSDTPELNFNKETKLKMAQAFEDTKGILVTDKRIRLRSSTN
jgi:poly-gamma-glutamate capsule biosynthesis protein CapA/YwtB (metallophosphatase superfamily)